MVAIKIDYGAMGPPHLEPLELQIAWVAGVFLDLDLEAFLYAGKSCVLPTDEKALSQSTLFYLLPSIQTGVNIKLHLNDSALARSARNFGLARTLQRLACYREPRFLLGKPLDAEGWPRLYCGVLQLIEALNGAVVGWCEVEIMEGSVENEPRKSGT